VAEHHDQRHLEHRHGVLQAARRAVVDAVARHVSGEEVAALDVEDQRRGHARVGAGQDRGEGGLRAGALLGDG
jgi:hypothetical protein